MKRSLDDAAIVLTALLLLAFAALSLRGLIAPEQASARFGAPVADAAGSLFYRVYLSRNLVIVITGAIFLLTRQWTPLAILLTVTAALPVFDMTVLSSNGVTPPVFHPLALALIAITAALAWRRVAAGKAEAPHAIPKTASRKIAMRLRLKTAVKSRSSRFWRSPPARLPRLRALVFRSNRPETRGFLHDHPPASRRSARFVPLQGFGGDRYRDHGAQSASRPALRGADVERRRQRRCHPDPEGPHRRAEPEGAAWPILPSRRSFTSRASISPRSTTPLA